MGYRIPERTARISFEGTDYDGAEVVVSLNMKFGTYRELLASRASQNFDAVIGLLSEFIREWNLEDADGAIPTTPEGFTRISDIGFVKALLEGWEAAVTGESVVAAPLDEPSSNGITSGNAIPSASPAG